MSEVVIDTLKSGKRRAIHLVHLRDLSEWPVVLPTRGEHLVLWVGMDATAASTEQITAIGERALDSGMVYLCAWGADCERVHDTIDEVIWERDLGSSERDVILTTWHSGEPLDDALWFFVNTAWPAEAYMESTRDWYAVVVGENRERDAAIQWFDRSHLRVDES